MFSIPTHPQSPAATSRRSLVPVADRPLSADTIAPATLVDRQRRAERLLDRDVTAINVRCQPHLPHPDVHVELPESTLLEADHEQMLFRRMNCLKKRARVLLSMLNRSKPSPALLDDIERLLSQSDRIRNTLICVFRKLAISVARKFASAAEPMDELVSEATVTLIRAVEIFDCERGVRFSTYLTHAVRRNLVRFLVGGQNRRRTMAPSGELQQTCDHHRWSEARQRKWTETLGRIDDLMDGLNRRERQILISRFGLGSERKPQTLKTLAERYGVSRERIRQLEQRAIAKLRRWARKQRLEHPD